MNKSESIAELAKALSKAQGAMKNAKKESDNPYFKSKYADLASVSDACRAELAANSLAIVQLPTMRDGKMVLEYALLHGSGEFISSELEMTPVKGDPQGIGSAITYARRYTLAGITGVATEDDDGNAASGNSAAKSAAKTGRITEDIPLEKPRSAQSNKGQGESVLQRGNDSPASAESVLADIPIPGAGCISVGESANLHREFRNTLPKKFQKNADALLSDWLRVQVPPIVDVLGKPSALAIKKESFYDIRTAVCDYARTFAV